MFDLNSAKRNVGFVAVAIGFIFLVTLLVQFVIQIVLMLTRPELLYSQLALQIINSVSMYLIAMPLSLIFFLRCKQVQRPERQKLPKTFLFQLFCVCMAGTYVCSMVGNYINEIFSAFLRREAVNPVEEMTSVMPWWQIVIFIVILAPVFEELFFRKLVIDRLLPYGELPAILISGVAFGMAHGNFNQFFYAAAIGIVFGFIYLRSGKIIYSIVLHMIFNLIGGLYTTEAIRFLESGTRFGELIGLAMNFLYLALLVVSAIVALVTVLGKGKRYLLFWRPYIAPTQRDWVEILLRNPAVWFFYAVVIVMFIL